MHCSKLMLACVAFGLGAVSLISIALAISTDYWLLLFEEVDFNTMHVEDDITVEDDMLFEDGLGLNFTKLPLTIEVYSKIGLFRFCTLVASMYKLLLLRNYPFTMGVPIVRVYKRCRV